MSEQDLQRLRGLRDRGLLTEEEYQAAISRLPSATAHTPRTPPAAAAPPAGGGPTARPGAAGPAGAGGEAGHPPLEVGQMPGAVEVPPVLAKAGRAVFGLLRGLVQDASHLWTAVVIPSVVVGGAAGLVYAITGGNLRLMMEEVGVSTVRAGILAITAAPPLSLHAAGRLEGQMNDTYLGLTAELTGVAHAPLALPAVVLLLGWALLLAAAWRRRPPVTLADAGRQVGRATAVFVIAMAVLAMVSRYGMHLTDISTTGDITLRVGVLSTIWWSLLLGGGTAALTMGVQLTRRLRGVTDPGWIADIIAVYRGAFTGSILLLLVAAATFTLSVIGVMTGEDPPSFEVGWAATIVVLLPMLLVWLVLLLLAVPWEWVTDWTDLTPLGAPRQSFGLLAENSQYPDVPGWLAWVIPLAFACLFVAGLVAAWTAARRGRPAGRAGALTGLAMASLWLPAAGLTSMSLRLKVSEVFGRTPELLAEMDLPAPDAMLRGGPELMVAAMVFLVGGSLLGWCGAMAAAPLWGRLPATPSRLLGGVPPATETTPPAAAVAREAAQRLNAHLAATAPPEEPQGDTVP